jgi:lipid-A-disaccharide synthase-like uncharacterized protein
MEAFWNFLWHDGQFLGIKWHVWKAVGWLGNAAFFSRFMVQWYATERHQRVVIPAAFWWLSLSGSLLLLAYAALYQKDSVFIFAYAFTWIPYIRNLTIHYRHHGRKVECPTCAQMAPPTARFCAQCGAALEPAASRRPES